MIEADSPSTQDRLINSYKRLTGAHAQEKIREKAPSIPHPVLLAERAISVAFPTFTEAVINIPDKTPWTGPAAWTTTVADGTVAIGSLALALNGQWELAAGIKLAYNSTVAAAPELYGSIKDRLTRKQNPSLT